ncbi:hypothetical protein niasHT_032521 [Heterodera trifolii]|uniref:Uncharacterized protein n=1 Tax=Heterodera trifolii TaxID=157864 RepID=A0ABD2I714_9BILA
MNGRIFDLSSVNCEIQVELSLTQIGQFVFAIRQEFFTQIAEHGTPNEGSNPKEHWTKKFRHELVNIGKEFGVSELIKEQKRRISLIRHYIAKKCDEYCETLNFDEKQCRQMESQIKVRLTVRELIDMARKLVKHKIVKPFFVAEPNFMTKLKMYIWWYRFRYRVDSAVIFEGSGRKSEFRLGIVQYYYELQETFQGQIEKIDNELAWLKEAIDKLDTIPYNVTVEPHTTDDEQYNFDPFNENEMSQETINALVTKPNDKVPIYIVLERFPIRLKIGAFAEAMGIQHHALKVYGIGEERLAKLKNWPPKVLKQPIDVTDTCKFMPKCFSGVEPNE